MAEHDGLLRHLTKALALLAHATGEAVGARTLLISMDANWQAATRRAAPADDFDHLALGMLLALSSMALKQSPQDPVIRQMYERYRSGSRH